MAGSQTYNGINGSDGLQRRTSQHAASGWLNTKSPLVIVVDDAPLRKGTDVITIICDKAAGDFCGAVSGHHQSVLLRLPARR